MGPWCKRQVLRNSFHPQTLVEKIVQKYAVGLSEGVKVRAGDYVMIKPEHVYVYPFKSAARRCADGILEG